MAKLATCRKVHPCAFGPTDCEGDREWDGVIGGYLCAVHRGRRDYMKADIAEALDTLSFYLLSKLNPEKLEQAHNLASELDEELNRPGGDLVEVTPAGLFLYLMDLVKMVNGMDEYADGCTPEPKA